MDKEQIEDTIELLALFDEKFTELSESSFAKSVFDNSGIDISFERGKQGMVKRRGPNDESIRAWAPSIRLLISRNDRISFRQMHLVYAQLPIDAISLKTLKSHREDVEKILNGPANAYTNMRIEPLKINGQEPSVLDFLERFIYGDIMHLDKDKRKDFVNWKSSPLIFAFAQDRFCVLSAHIINLASELVGFNAWITRKLKKQL